MEADLLLTQEKAGWGKQREPSSERQVRPELMLLTLIVLAWSPCSLNLTSFFWKLGGYSQLAVCNEEEI